MSDIIRFGLVKYKGAVSGVRVQSVTYGETSSSAEATDEDGNIEQINVYGKKRTIQCDGNIIDDGDISALKVGASLTVDSQDFTIDSLSIREGVNTHSTISITGSAPISVSGKSSPSGQGTS